MKIGVISDTHLKNPNPELKKLLKGPFQDVDMILHAGDITELAVLESFADKKVLAVCGNMDSWAVRRGLPNKRIIQTGRIKIGLIHGWGGLQGIEERIQQEFEGVQGIVFGHTHMATHVHREGIFFFNPGAFGESNFGGCRSVGLLEVEDQISGEVISF